VDRPAGCLCCCLSVVRCVCFICIWYNMAGFMVRNRDREHNVPNGILLRLVHNFRIFGYVLHLTVFLSLNILKIMPSSACPCVSSGLQ